jgi:hypothetical protein
MRVPLIVSQPGRVAAGTRTNSFGYVTDITPTLLDIAGVTPPGERYRGRPVHPIMGESMRALLEGRQEQVHDASRTTVYELAGGIAVWRGNYKLVTSSTNAIPARIGPQLFDTANDPLERHNLAQQHPEIVSELYQAYRDYVERYRVIEVPPDYRAWEQVTRNGREQFIAKNRVALALAGPAPLRQLLLMYMVISARNTSLFATHALTGTTTSPGVFQSIVLPSATVRTSPSALARYSTVMPRGIQRRPSPTEASHIVPAANSAALQSAMACTVPRWFSTSLRLAKLTSARPGRRSWNTGAMVEKYGAVSPIRLLKASGPTCSYICRILLIVTFLRDKLSGCGHRAIMHQSGMFF